MLEISRINFTLLLQENLQKSTMADDEKDEKKNTIKFPHGKLFILVTIIAIILGIILGIVLR